MKYTYTTLALAALALAETHQVQVGPGLSYSPDSVTAAQGDIVQFTFGSGHDVVSGSFDQPCQPDGKIMSGEPQDGQVFSVTVNSTDPIWIYCSVPRHCQSGMVMAINAPSSGNTLDSYKSAASSTSGSSAPGDVTGGTFGAVSDSGSSSAAASVTSAMASASSEAGSASTSAAASASSAEASASSAGSSAASAASAAATSAGSSGDAGNVVAPLSLVLGAVMGGAALLL